MGKQYERIFVRIFTIFEGQAEGRFAITALVLVVVTYVIGNVVIRALM